MTKKLSAFILALLLIFALPVSVSANAAEPPGMTIIVEDAPDDISLTLELAEEPEYEPHVRKAKKNWEVYFHLYYYFGFTLNLFRLHYVLLNFLLMSLSLFLHM